MTQIQLSFNDNHVVRYSLAECVKYFGLIANAVEDVPAETMCLDVGMDEFDALISACRRCDGPIRSECAEYMLCVFPSECHPTVHFAMTGTPELLREACEAWGGNDFGALCGLAIKNDNYECFVYLYDKYVSAPRVTGYVFSNPDEVIMTHAAYQRPEYVKYIYGKSASADWDPRMAVEAQQHETLDFMLSVSRYRAEQALDGAISLDDDVAMKIILDRVKNIEYVGRDYFLEDSIKCFRLAYDAIQPEAVIAVIAGKRHAVKCLGEMLDRGCPMSQYSVMYAAFDVDCMRRAWDSCHEIHPRACEYATSLRNFDSFVFAFERGVPLDSNIYAIAAANGSVDIIEYAYWHDCPLEEHDLEAISRREVSPGRFALFRLFGGEVEIKTARGITAKVTYRGTPRYTAEDAMPWPPAQSN